MPLKRLFCPITEICPIYKEWSSFEKRSLDVIDDLYNGSYGCMALISCRDEHDQPDPERKLRFNSERDYDCVLIHILNSLENTKIK